MDLNFLIPIAQAAEEAVAQSTSPAAGLGLNWKLFVAQLVNFGIVLFILWRWIFKPITAALQKRTEKIEKSLRDAETVAKDKENFEKWKAEQIINARHEASLIINKAQTDATKVKDDLLVQTKNEHQKLVADAKKQIQLEKNQSLQSAKAELADLVTTATEKIIRQKLTEKKDEELIKNLLKSI